MTATAEDLHLDLARRKSLLLRQAYSLDVRRFIREQVRTRDEHERQTPVKPMPFKPYFETILSELENEQIVYVVKSRQMMITWLACAYALWTVLFADHQMVAVISKKLEDAQEFVGRIRFIYANMDIWLRNLCPLDRNIRDIPIGFLYLKNGSKTAAIPQGPDQIRMHTATLIILDEADYLDQFDRTSEACAPSIFGGGKMLAISSVGGGAFSRAAGLT